GLCVADLPGRGAGPARASAHRRHHAGAALRARGPQAYPRRLSVADVVGAVADGRRQLETDRDRHGYAPACHRAARGRVRRGRAVCRRGHGPAGARRPGPRAGRRRAAAGFQPRRPAHLSVRSASYACLAMTLTLFLAVLLGLIALGMPIAFALLLSAVALMFQLNFFDSQILAQNMLSGANSFTLMAVPLFMLAGEIMNAGGLSRRIVNMASTFVGHIPGGLGYVAIFASVLLAALSGSAVADAAALGTLLIPMLRDKGYSAEQASGLIAAGGIVAPIIPPSISFIIFGVATNVSITKLFFAGIAPGLLMGLTLVAVWTWVARRHGSLTPTPRESWPVRLRALRQAAWALMLPVIIIGGLRG